MTALIRGCQADAVAGPAKTVRLKNYKSKSAHVAEALSRLWDGSVGPGAHVAESLSK